MDEDTKNRYLKLGLGLMASAPVIGIAAVWWNALAGMSDATANASAATAAISLVTGFAVAVAATSP